MVLAVVCHETAAAAQPSAGEASPAAATASGTRSRVEPPAWIEAAAPPAPEAAATAAQAATADVAQPQTPAAAKRADPSLEVMVRGDSRADRRRKSAEAVTVVELDQAKHESADLGQVLARKEGVGVRRSGGLGSDTGLSLNGLVDDQIRFFLDGIPLELQGYTYGIGNVPVNLIERVEVFAGVVPVRYGADALGGAVDLRTDPGVQGTHVAGSYEVGSFGTLRLTASGRQLFESSGFFVSANGFLDSARNDYHVDDVLVADVDGSERTVRAKRFHDDYRAAGGNIELGFVQRPWARRLLLRAYYTGFDQEIQNNPPMTLAYGGLEYGERTAGVSLRYERALSEQVSLRAVAGYAFQRGNFVDVDTCVWNWLGECGMQSPPGETDTVPHDKVNDDDSLYVRLELGMNPAERHALRVTFAPTYFTRSGDERHDKPGEIDELNSVRRMFGIVSGAEYEVDAFDDRLENIAFGKLYYQYARNAEVVPGGILDREERHFRGGVGNALRFWLSKVLYAKASYEYATRLPSPEESFGDNVFVREQTEDLLRPETSHNGNLSLVLDARETRVGALRGAVNGFVRSMDDLIVRIGFERGSAYQNVASARSLGIEGVVDWTSPGDHVSLGGNVTYMDFKNVSKTGTFSEYHGDRIPNRPYLLANATARFELHDLLARGDEAWLSSHTGYVASFWLGWESIGSLESRLTVPSQLVETLALGYLRRISKTTLTGTIEARNVTNAEAYDYFGAQRPGRAFYVKTTIEH